jgi:hypothetical protein
MLMLEPISKQWASPEISSTKCLGQHQDTAPSCQKRKKTLRMIRTIMADRLRPLPSAIVLLGNSSTPSPESDCKTSMIV